jgi:hypothetical protein
MVIIIALLHHIAIVYAVIIVLFWLAMHGKQQCQFKVICRFRMQPALGVRRHAHLAHEQI